MHEARAIDQNIERAHRLRYVARERFDGRRRAHVELLAPCRAEPFELAGVEIGRDDAGAFGDEGLANGASDPLSCRGHERDLVLETLGHLCCLSESASTPC